MHGKIETRVGLLVLGALIIFAYMGFKIGTFKLDRSRHHVYQMYFKDISGLSRKADVKIAGVKVGWVEAVNLIPDAALPVQATIMICNEYKLYSDAYAVVRQDGLLGTKYLEIMPGDPLLPHLVPGSTLGQPSVAPVSIDEVMQQFKRIAANVECVTESFKTALGNSAAGNQLTTIMHNLHETTSRMSSFTAMLETSLIRNEQKLDSLFEIGEHVKQLSIQLQTQILPTISEGIERISHVFDRDFSSFTHKIETTSESLQEASAQIRDGFKNISSITEKIDEGKGLIGKLINEDETYRDIKISVQGLKNYFAKIDTLQIVFDAHYESMYRPGEHYKFEDSKGFFDIRVHPTEDRFYIFQIASSEKGYINRHVIEREYFDRNGDPVPPERLRETFDTRQFFREDVTQKSRYTYKLALQFGKIFNRLAFRFGLFENTPGVAVDFDIPLYNDKLRWVTSFELFELNGWNRQWDRRPHLKWINRIFFLRNIYINFGADDFISKHNANAFFGAGIRFGDDDFKYLLGSVSGLVNGFTAGNSILS